MKDKLGVAIVGTALEKGVVEMADMVRYAEVKEAQGEARGKAQGKLIGEAQGKLIGEAQGKIIGERKGRTETAINLIKMGILTIQQISQSTGLSEEDVIAAKNSIDGN